MLFSSAKFSEIRKGFKKINPPVIFSGKVSFNFKQVEAPNPWPTR